MAKKQPKWQVLEEFNRGLLDDISALIVLRTRRLAVADECLAAYFRAGAARNPRKGKRA